MKPDKRFCQSMMATNQHAAPAVILGSNLTALPITRSLGRRGIDVYAFDLNCPGVASHSRFLKSFQVFDAESELSQALISFSEARDEVPVIIPTADDSLLFLARYREALGARFRFHFPTTYPLETLVRKGSGQQIYDRLGIPTPKTLVVGQEMQFDEGVLGSLGMPVIIKPDLHDHWLNNEEFRKRFGYQKVILVEDRENLNEVIRELVRYDTLVIQEYIRGESTDLYYFMGYRGASGELLGSLVGRKHRTYPDTLGTEVLLESVASEEVTRLGEQILKALEYHGIAGIDVKFDRAENSWKVLEINYRFGLTDGLAVACGVDLPYLFYLDVQGFSPLKQGPGRSGVFWNWLDRDIDWLRDYGGGKGVSVWSWFSSRLTRRYHYPFFAVDDLSPFAHELCRLAGRMARKVISFLRLSG